MGNDIECFLHRYVPRNNITTQNHFNNFIAALSIFEFGSFKDFTDFQNETIRSLDHINIKELYKEVFNSFLRHIYLKFIARS